MHETIPQVVHSISCIGWRAAYTTRNRHICETDDELGTSAVGFFVPPILQGLTIGAQSQLRGYEILGSDITVCCIWNGLYAADCRQHIWPALTAILRGSIRH